MPTTRSHKKIIKLSTILMLQILGYGSVVDLWCLTPHSTIFQLHCGSQFYRWRWFCGKLWRFLNLSEESIVIY